MDRRFDTRLGEMLAQAQVSPELTEGLLTRLETFIEPFTASLAEPEQRRHTVEYLTGLLSKLKHKTGEGIAYLHDQKRQGLQKFIGLVPWSDASLLLTLARQVGADLGEADGVIVFDPSAFAKKGTARSACNASGVAGSARRRTARSAFTWPTYLVKNIRSSTRVFIFPRSGRRTAGGARRPEFPRRSSSVPATNWRWRCWRNTVRCCRTPGWPATMRWAVLRIFA